MAIFIDGTLTPQSTLFVHSCPSVYSDPDMGAEACRVRGTPSISKRTPEREWTEQVLRALEATMDAAKIERFQDQHFHGIMPPFDSYDLFASVKEVQVILKAVADDAQPGPRGYVEFAGFRFARSAAISSTLLVGQSSQLYNLVPVWLLEEAEVEKLKQQREWEQSPEAKRLSDKAAQENAGITVTELYSGGALPQP